MARIVDLRRLPQQAQRTIADYTGAHPRRSDGMRWDVSSTMQLRDALDVWLNSQGIVNHTDGIWALIRISRDEESDACLEEALAELEGLSDIIDGPDDQPRPNSAMRAQMLIEQALGKRPIA